MNIATPHHAARRPGSPGRARPKLDQKAFERIAAIALADAGLDIAPSKMAMVHTRLARRLRALGLADYEAYCSLIESPEGSDERREMISSLTTNVSHFFREDHHFERLVQEVLPGLRKKIEAGQRVRIWSAGCSNGQEPYTIAMSILENYALPEQADLRILASDIDPKVVAFARRGAYDERMVSGVAAELLEKYFTRQKTGTGTTWVTSQQLKRLISFRELNLLKPWPMQGKFDVIFCRNVVIYFNEETQQELWKNFARILHPGGWLFLGHSERVSEHYLDLLSPAGMTTYRRTDTPGAL